MIDQRSSGILLHISSLPSQHGIGDLGPEAYKFADYLNHTHQSYWQILPLTPVSEALGDSPYSSISAFAGNILFISLEKLCQEGLLETSDIENLPISFSNESTKTDYSLVRQYKEPLLDKAYRNFLKINDKNIKDDFESFCKLEADWLDDFSLFKSLKDRFAQKSWIEWEPALVTREQSALEKYKQDLKKFIEQEKFLQFLFQKQWKELKSYCNDRGVHFFGDLPIYVNYDSVDVWVHSSFFKLNNDKKPEFVAGTPPDYFSKTGQLWGNPVYNWEALQNDGFKWWVKRIGHNFKLFDLVRLDHFLGFVNFYEIPAEDSTALNGKWVPAPVNKFLDTLINNFQNLPIIAEDLGTLSDAVLACMREYNLPGMAVLMFAFGSDMVHNLYLPHNHKERSVVYTGTHDNNTVKGWWVQDARQIEKENFGNYVHKWVDQSNVTDEMCWMAMNSVCQICILPMQDILNLDETARMNIPGVGKGNWAWRLDQNWLNDNLVNKLKYYTEISNRWNRIAVDK